MNFAWHIESMELPVVINRHDKTPVWLQLSQALRERISTGQLAAGVAMPSSRELADTLGLSRATVVRSYGDLIRQGYLHAIRGGGTSVSRSARGPLDVARQGRPSTDPQTVETLSNDG